jgi:hypothetical protein
MSARTRVGVSERDADGLAAGAESVRSSDVGSGDQTREPSSPPYLSAWEAPSITVLHTPEAARPRSNGATLMALVAAFLTGAIFDEISDIMGLAPNVAYGLLVILLSLWLSGAFFATSAGWRNGIIAQLSCLVLVAIGLALTFAL